MVILEEPHGPWAGHPGEEVWPERRHTALGGHLERVIGGGTGAGRSSREGWEGPAKKGPNGRHEAGGRGGSKALAASPQTRSCIRRATSQHVRWNLPETVPSVQHSLYERQPHTHTHRAEFCPVFVSSFVWQSLNAAVLGDIWGPDSWTSTSQWLVLLRARGSVHTAGCSESVSVSSPCFLVKASGRGPPSHTGSPKITHSHIYTHIYTRTHAHTCMHTRTGRLTHTNACTLTHINTHTCTRTPTHMQLDPSFSLMAHLKIVFQFPSSRPIAKNSFDSYYKNDHCYLHKSRAHNPQCHRAQRWFLTNGWRPSH